MKERLEPTAEALLDIYEEFKYSRDTKDKAKATAARRDMNRFLIGSRLIYSRIHGVYIPKSEYEPDLLRDVPFSVDKIKGGLRQTTLIEQGGF